MRRWADSTPSRAERSRRGGRRASRAVQELGVDLERLISTLVRPSRSLCSCHKLEHAFLRSCEPCADSCTVRAGQSRPRWHPLPFSSRKLALSLAGRLSTAPVGAHRVSRESCRAQAAERCPSRRPYSSRRLREPSRRGRVPPRLHPPSRAPEGSGCTLVSRSHGHCPCGTTVRPATS